MQIEVIGMNWNRSVLELYDDLDALALGLRGEIQQRMFVEPELSKHAVEAIAGRLRHTGIVKEVGNLEVLGIFRL